jgi:hypothetical protein
MERRCETSTARRSGGRTSKIGLDREVDLGDVGHHLAVPALLQHALAEFLPSWSHVLTVTAPRRVKLHKPIPGRGSGHTLSQVFKIFRREDLRDPSTLRGGELLGHFSRLFSLHSARLERVPLSTASQSSRMPLWSCALTHTLTVSAASPIATSSEARPSVAMPSSRQANIRKTFRSMFDD